MKRLRIEFSPAFGVQALRLPSGWPKEPVVEARQDGLDVITLSVLACHPLEEWRFVLLRGSVLSTVSVLTGPAVTRPTRTNFEMGLCIPPALVGRLPIDRGGLRE